LIKAQACEVNEALTFILYLALILLLTKVLGHLATMLGQPSVLGKLLTGIIVGPAVLGWIEKRYHSTFCGNNRAGRRFWDGLKSSPLF
jgi:hypothetical protein